MKGIIHLMIKSARIRYEMEFKRNITIIKGDSATGKTTLVDMVREYEQNGADTGISISCDVPCRVISGNNWQEQLKNINNSLVFIDEGNRFVTEKEFAHAIKETDNYYVIITRESLYTLPYSVDEIYGIKSSGKYNLGEKVYNQMYRIYGEYNNCKEYKKIIVEDSNSGFEFFTEISKTSNVECVSANGASNIFGLLQEINIKENVIVVADGAAFGAYIDKIYKLMEKNKNIKLYLPESFEWIILSSNVLNDNEIMDIINEPSIYIDSKEYFSWEQYFTYLLTNKTKDTYLKYTKKELNLAYLQGKTLEKLKKSIPKEVLI